MWTRPLQSGLVEATPRYVAQSVTNRGTSFLAAPDGHPRWGLYWKRSFRSAPARGQAWPQVIAAHEGVLHSYLRVCRLSH